MAAKRKPMNARTKQLLIATDVMTERGLTLTAKPRRCRTCHSACWAGMALVGPSAGVWVTYTPTTAFGEMLALSANIPTYEIDGTLLIQRCAYTIGKKSADDVFVHVLHLCNGPPLPVNPAWNKHFPPTTKIEYPETPPF